MQLFKDIYVIMKVESVIVTNMCGWFWGTINGLCNVKVTLLPLSVKCLLIKFDKSVMCVCVCVYMFVSVYGPLIQPPVSKRPYLLCPFFLSFIYIGFTKLNCNYFRSSQGREGNSENTKYEC